MDSEATWSNASEEDGDEPGDVVVGFHRSRFWLRISHGHCPGSHVSSPESTWGEIGQHDGQGTTVPASPALSPTIGDRPPAAEQRQVDAQSGHRHNTTTATIDGSFPRPLTACRKRRVVTRCDIPPVYASFLDRFKRSFAMPVRRAAHPDRAGE